VSRLLISIVACLGLAFATPSHAQADESSAIRTSTTLEGEAVDIAVDAVGGRVYVLFTGPAAISIRDSRSLEEIRRINVGGSVSQLTVDEVGQRAFVLGSLDRDIRIVDIPTGDVSDPIVLPDAQILGAVPTAGGLAVTGSNGAIYLYNISRRQFINQTPFGQSLIPGPVGSNLYWNPFDGRLLRIPVADLTGQRPVSGLREWMTAFDMNLLTDSGPGFLGGTPGLQRIDLNTGQSRLRETQIPVAALGANARHLPGRVFWSQSEDFSSSEFHISDSETLSDLFAFPVDSAISKIAVAPDGLFALSTRASRLFAIDSSATGVSEPRRIRVKSSVRSLQVRWRPPEVSGSGGVTRYRVSVSPSGKSCVTKRRTCTIKGLQPDTRYEVRVSAQNELGWGAESRVTRVKTNRAPTPSPGAPPRNPEKPTRPVS